jgi:predicted MFS family arabinose efflux permease
MVAADLSRLTTQGILAALLIAGAPPIWAIAILAGATGAATGFFNPASSGLLPGVVAPEQLQQANGLRATAMSGGEIAGPALGGVLVAAAGPGWAIAVDAATFAASAAFLAGLRLPARLPREEPNSFVADLRQGWTEFRSRTWVWTFVGAGGIATLMWGTWTVLGPVVAERDLGGAAAWGTVLAALGVGAMVGALIAIRIRPRRPLALGAICLTAFGLPPALLALGAPVPVLAIGTFLAGAGMMLDGSVWESTLQREIPNEALSRVAAYDWFGSLALGPIGLAVAGPLAALLGIDGALWLAAAAIVAVALGLLAVRDVRTMPGV